MLARQSHSGEDPDEGERSVDPGEARKGQVEERAQRHNSGLDHVAQANEERVNGGLGLVLRLSGSGQEERLADRVLERVVGGVLEGLAPFDKTKERNQAD